ncbi:cupin-like domain-containing protein [Nitrosomonas communis]|uniref:Cupin-like domain-containing protein n=1 Tax=Nitrosomonas communis TaxID=44574 RepID=A0A1H2S4G1_9PROT|nr:cupin-like domain-containing protein [Nitrosomonas communis]SDW25849.1 Cupin-like domain-containing protein [Nitrosomonas communis]
MEIADKTLKRTTLTSVKSMLATPLAGIATFLYATWQLVIEQQFFLRMLFVERMGKRGVVRLPLGYGNVLALKSIMLCQHLTNNPNLLQKMRRQTEQRMLKRLQNYNLPRRVVLNIAEYHPGKIEPHQFYHEHVKRAVPCILRGFVENAPQDWTLARLAERFPDTIVQVLDKNAKKMINTSLSEVALDLRRNFIPQQLLLDQNPAFYHYFGIPRSHAYFPVMGRPSKPILSFLILGLGKGLNANYHCEEGINWYQAVSGSKHWTLIESEYSWLLYPAARGNGMRRFADFRADEQGEPSDRDTYALVEYAPRYEFDLHPGDVLFFPAWMWHKTINLDEEGLGITCRYSAPAVMSNRYFRGLQLLSAGFWKSCVEVISSSIRGNIGDLAKDTDHNEQETTLY